MKISLQEFREIVRSVLEEAPPAPAPATPAAGTPAAPAPAAGTPAAPADSAPPAPEATPVVADVKAVADALTKAIASAKDPSTKTTLANMSKTIQTLLQNVPK